MAKFYRTGMVSALAALGITACVMDAADMPGDEELEVESAEQALSCASLVIPTTSLESATSSIKRSGAYDASYEAYNAFDGKSSMWISQPNQTPAWISYEWKDGPRLVTRYAIKFANGSLTSRAPKDWTLQGWDGSKWVVVDTRSNQTNWQGVERREFVVQNPGLYKAYALNVTDDNDTRAGVVALSIDELEFFDCGDVSVAFPMEFYMQLAGLPAPDEFGEVKEVDGCEVLVEQGAVTFNNGNTRSCTYEPPPGWQLVGGRVEVLENRNNRGSYNYSILQNNSKLSALHKELGAKWKTAIDWSIKYKDVEAKRKLEFEYQRQQEYFFEIASNNAAMYLEATANGGLLKKSRIHVRSKVKLVRIH